MQQSKGKQESSQSCEPGVDCHKCGRRTRRIVVDVHNVDIPSVLFFGVFGLAFSAKSGKVLQCQHCGKTFKPKLKPPSGRDRLIGAILGVISLGLILAVCLLIFWR